MIKGFRSISAERIQPNSRIFSPVYYQSQKVYSFCQRYTKNKMLLEIGCGSGSGAFRMSGLAKKVIAIDKDSQIIKYNQGKFRCKNLKFINSDVKDYKTDSKFDLIILLQVIEHLKYPEEILKLILCKIKKNSVVILSTPNKLSQSFNENPYHFREYSSGELSVMLKKYFKKVKLYGLYGNSLVKEYEKRRKDQIMSILNLDKPKLRRFIPRIVLKLLFNLAAYLNKRLLANGMGEIGLISEGSYKIKKKTDGSIDLIAVAQK